MAVIFEFATTLDLLNSLKHFVKERMQNESTLRIFKTVKKGIVDYKDEYPIISIEPNFEQIATIGSNEMFIIHRTINFKIWAIGWEKDKIKKKLRQYADVFKVQLKPIIDDWMLADENGVFKVFNISFDPEEMASPQGVERQWVQYYNFPITFSGFYEYPQDKVITTYLNETNYDDLLEFVFQRVKRETTFKKYFRDVLTPTELGELPGLLVKYTEPQANRDDYTSAESIDALIDLVVYDFLATREIALDKHLRNVNQAFNFVLRNEDMGGKVELFSVSTISYGFEIFDTTKPVYSTIISTQGKFTKDLYS